jgi:small basic protein (TIGR04137 family)
MSVHTSLRSKGASGTTRSVMKRFERVRQMMDKGTWIDGRSIYGLPKVKQVKIKAQKAAPKEKDAAAAAEGAAPGTAAAPAAGKAA